MHSVPQVSVPLCSASGQAVATLHIAVLPRRGNVPVATLWSAESDGNSDGHHADAELLEGMEYRYAWEGVPPSADTLIMDPEEIFQPDGLDGRTGRLRPGLATGTIRVAVRIGESSLGQLQLEVRSRKLSYRSEYRWMLRDIAERMTELVMERFAVSDARFELDDTRDAATLYQRFAFLKALFESENFQGALREIIRRPHTAWETVSETVRPRAGMRASSHVLRQLTKAGARSVWTGGPLTSVPAYLERQQTEATHDTTPNRFVRFALEQWNQMFGSIDRGLAKAKTSAAARGRREIAAVMSQLEEILHQDLFAQVSRLDRFPADDQVLQKREGYRDIFKAYVETEFASRLSWLSAPDDYGAGQRDVATLYEYWAFIQLSQLVADLIGQQFDMSPLVRSGPNGLTVGLRTGIETVLSGVVDRLDRRLHVELCFNRTYSGNAARIGSWTRPMRPDYSLLIRPADSESSSFEPIALHFDAKYRVDFVSEIFGADEDEGSNAPDTPTNLERGGALRADLLKMHAYRDAIHRTAGAYVLYPGGDSEAERGQYREYHELLPGLGAFVLRPTEFGNASGAPALRRFIDDVLDHVATRLTKHERSRYWLEAAYGFSPRPEVVQSRLLPPPETDVLIGFVKGQEHWDWIREHGAYNVRAEGRPGGVNAGAALLQCQLLFLYCPASQEVALARIVSDAELVSKIGMEATGYPEARGSYWCVQLQWLKGVDWILGVSADSIEAHVRHLGLTYGEPARVRWSELQSILDGGSPGIERSYFP